MSESDDIDSIREKRRQELQQQLSGQPNAGQQSAEPAGSPAEPVHVNSRAELDQLATEHRLVLADFYADWCGPCKMLEPTVREIAQNTDAAVAKVDVDALPQLAQEMRVQGVPSLFLYVDGEPIKRMTGVQDYGTLERLIEQYVA